MPSLNTLRETCLEALRRAGTPEENAALQVDLLLEAELRNHVSHGILRLPRLIERIANGVADPVTTGRARWRGETLLEVDGQMGLGPVVASAAIAQIHEKARHTGVALAAIRNCNHLGMMAWYAERVAREGQVLLALTTSEALVHPWGGRHAMIGTNPIAIGVPAQPRPFVMDMATSLVSMGKIHDHANRGRPIPEGWALDADGNPTTDARAATKGAIAPFGGPKGYALGLGFEVLVAALTASALGTDVAGTLDSEKVCNKGDLFIVMEPATGAAAAVSAYLDTIRAVAPADPAQPVQVPGDRASATRQRRAAHDLDVDEGIWARIRALAAEPASQAAAQPFAPVENRPEKR